MKSGQNWARPRGLGPMLGRRLGVEVAPGMLIALAVGRRAVSMAAMRRLRKGTPASPIPIKTLLGQRRVGAAPLHLVICEPELVHRTLLVPHMTTSEESEVVRREIARDGAGDRTSAWRHVRRVETDGVRKDELLIVAAPLGRLHQVLDPIIVGGVVPRLVVTGPLDRPTVLVHWGVSSVTIVIVSEGALKFARVIEPPAPDLDPLEWMPVEIDRSIRHHAVHSKGERVEQVMVSVAEAAPARRLFAGAELATRVHLPVTNLNALLAPQLPDRANGDSDLMDVEMAEGVFTLAYGAALLSPQVVPNLLPDALVVWRRSRQVIGASVAANVLLALALGSKSMLMTGQAQELRSRLARAQATRQALQVRVEEAGRIEAERQRMGEVARLLTEDPLKRLPVDDALREIARLAPDQLQLDQLALSTDASGHTFRLAGRVQEPDFADAQNTLNRFYYGLRGSPLFYDVQIQENRTQSAGADTSSPGGVADNNARSLPFALVLKPKELT